MADDDLKKKLAKWRSSWVSSDAEAKKANLEAGKIKKEARDRVVGEVESAGVSVKAFREKMVELDHLDKAMGKRGTIEDTVVLQEFDRLTVLDESTLPLFDAATKAEIEKNARASVNDDEDDKPQMEGKIIPIGGASLQ